MADTRTGRNGRSPATRESILAVAERLFAEHGISALSNRRIGEAAGQGNNFAVGHHFGTRADPVRAVVRRHAEPMERRRSRMIAETRARRGGHGQVRDWVACLVRPLTEHLEALGGPTWFARFGAQVTTDPVPRRVVLDEALATRPVQQVLDGLDRCLPALPPSVRLERGDMARNLVSHVCAERERALAEGSPAHERNRHERTWEDTAAGLIDAITGLWAAPVTTTGA
ncbi:helix-turn-helix domain-containing protein [Streptomyces macrosporus]|uniref:TetR/AcrR family transcriptional regulator n=1 Tax=Streptomyces macrosporus TaxID=44032 RepID=A0ABN3JF54_9ACTN